MHTEKLPPRWLKTIHLEGTLESRAVTEDRAKRLRLAVMIGQLTTIIVSGWFVLMFVYAFLVPDTDKNALIFWPFR
jgi:hypothetical protein